MDDTTSSSPLSSQTPTVSQAIPQQAPSSVPSWLKVVVIVQAVIIIGLLSLFIFLSVTGVSLKPKEINSFQECVDAGGIVMESYPARCMTKDKQTFTQPLSVAEQQRLDAAAQGKKMANDTRTASEEIPANWHTYTHPHFTIRYPANWEVVIDTFKEGQGITGQVNFGPVGEGGHGYDGILAFSVVDKSLIPPSQDDPAYQVTESQVTLNGRSALLKVSRNDSIPDPNWVSKIYTFDSPKYQFAFSNGAILTYDPVFEQMASSIVISE